MPEVTAEEGLAALRCADKILVSVRKHKWQDKIEYNIQSGTH
jgi:hypothetical protein